MPADQSEERKAAMAAFGAELISVPSSSDGGGMEAARDMAARMQVSSHPAAPCCCSMHDHIEPYVLVRLALDTSTICLSCCHQTEVMDPCLHIDASPAFVTSVYELNNVCHSGRLCDAEFVHADCLLVPYA